MPLASSIHPGVGQHWEHWVRGARSPPTQGTLGEVGGISCPPSQAGVAVLQRPWHHTLPWGPHSKRIFLGQLRYGLSRFHLPNYET